MEYILKMSSNSDSLKSFEHRRKHDANSTLAQIYRDSVPRIHLQTGFADEEIEIAIEKITRGLNILIDLCNLEMDHHALQNSDFNSDLDYLDSLRRPVFAGANLGYVVSEDALRLINNLRVTNRYEDVDCNALTDSLYRFFKICIETETGAGDMYLRISDALFILTKIDESYELEITRDLVREALGGKSLLKRWLLGVLAQLDTTLIDDEFTDDKIAVVRFFDRDYVVAYATDEFVTFDEMDFNLENKSRFTEEYVYGQVYRNDKIFPKNPEEWLSIVIPEDDQTFILGRRFYDTLEEAQESEREFMNWLQALLDD